MAGRPGVGDDKMADGLTGLGSLDRPVGPQPLVAISCFGIRRSLQADLFKEIDTEWVNSTGMRQTERDPPNSKKIHTLD